MNIVFDTNVITNKPYVMIEEPSEKLTELIQTIADGKSFDISEETIKALRDASEERKQCVVCLNGLKAQWYPLGYTHANLLKKMYQQVVEYGENIVDLKSIEAQHIISYNEKSASTVARFHGLIAKRKVNGVHVPNEWVITRRGAAFLRNQVRIPKKVKTYKNKVVDHWHEDISIVDILGQDPRVVQTVPFERDLATADDINLAEAKRS